MRARRWHILLYVIAIFAWVFSGWPQVWDNPRIPQPVQNVFADTTSTNYAGTAADGGDGNSCTWANPGNATGDTTSTVATCDLSGNNTLSNRLILTNFGFTSSDVPSGASIDGVIVEVEWQGEGTQINDELVQLTTDGSTGTGDDKGANSTQTTKAIDTYGGSLDGWNASLTQSAVTSSNFGVILRYNKSAGGAPQEARVFRVRITIDYTPPSIDPPTVTTNAATSITTSSATLNGEITATGGEDATQHGFAFGTNSALSGGDTATSTLGSKSGTGTFSESETSLNPSTTYYFRGYATNSGGTGYGSILNFTTSAAVTSISVDPTSFDYGAVPAGQASSTNPAFTITVTNTGDTTVTLDIAGQNTACPWTLSGTSGDDAYVHQFCKASDVSCTSPPTNYSGNELTTGLQTLYTGVPPTSSNTRDLDLRVIVPNPSSCFSPQSVDILIQATAE